MRAMPLTLTFIFATLLSSFESGCGSAAPVAPEETVKPVAPEETVKPLLIKMLDAWSLGINSDQLYVNHKIDDVYFFDEAWVDGAVLLRYEIKGFRERPEWAGSTDVPGSKVFSVTVNLTFQSRAGTEKTQQRIYIASMAQEAGTTHHWWHFTTVLPLIATP